MPNQLRDAGNLLDLSLLEPYGVIAAIVPFDWPPVHTASKLARRVSRAVRAGAVLVNNYNRAFTGMPFGGVGASGYGRELAVETLHEHAYTKSIRLPSGTAEIPRWAPSVEVTGRAQ